MLGEHVGVVGGWTNPRRDDAEIRRLRGRYQALVHERTARSRNWSIKDPRLCLLGDVLLEALLRQGIESRIVTTTRPESQVIASLMRRGQTEVDASRIAVTFEAGRQSILHLAKTRQIPCLEVGLASAASRDEVVREVQSLQMFLGCTRHERTHPLADLVRFER
jgi:hypothetical protein